MSLWYFSRSHSVKSKAFDWTQVGHGPHACSFSALNYNRELTISSEFSSSCMLQRGRFDPTVKRVRFHKELCYVYQVGGRFFRTIKSLLISRVLCITGRKTRVWEAVEVAGTSEE